MLLLLLPLSSGPAAGAAAVVLDPAVGLTRTKLAASPLILPLTMSFTSCPGSTALVTSRLRQSLLLLLLLAPSAAAPGVAAAAVAATTAAAGLPVCKEAAAGTAS